MTNAFHRRVFQHYIATTGDDAEAANENVARQEQCRLYRDRIGQGNPQKLSSHIDRVREIVFESGADLRSAKSLRCYGRAVHFHATDRIVTANSNFSQTTAARVVTSRSITVKQLVALNLISPQVDFYKISIFRALGENDRRRVILSLSLSLDLDLSWKRIRHSTARAASARSGLEGPFFLLQINEHF